MTTLEKIRACNGSFIVERTEDQKNTFSGKVVCSAKSRDTIEEHSSVRVWKLGDHKAGIFPTKEAVNTLLDILSKSNTEGPTDLAWDSMLDVEMLYANPHANIGDALIYRDPSVFSIDGVDYDIVSPTDVVAVIPQEEEKDG